MAVNEVHLISKRGAAPPTTVLLHVGAIAANLSFLDRPLKKAGRSELRPLFEADGETWVPRVDVLSAFENARAFFTDPAQDEILFEAVAEQLGPAIDVLRALPKDSVVRLEVIKTKPRRPAKSKRTGAEKSGSCAAPSAVKMKLPKHAASAVAEAMSHEETKRSFEDFIAHCLQNDAKEAIANTRPNHPQWPEPWLERRVRFDWICDWPNGWYLRGVARRAATGDLDEFVLFIQMHVRQAVLNHRANDDEYTEVWSLLPALAIGDELAIERHLANATFPLSGGHADTRNIYNGVHALLREDTPEINRLRKKSPSKSTPAWLKGLMQCLQGIADRDASRVAAGIDEHLKGFYKAFRISPMERILSLEAHGLFRLAERIDPKLVQEFDTDRDAPWDREFHAWSTNRRPGLSVDRFGDCPRDLCTPFVTLEVPPWLKDSQ